MTWMSKGSGARFPQILVRYVVSIAALGLAVALTVLILHFHLPRLLFNYIFLVVIIGSAWWGGYGPGLLTTLSTVLFGPYLVMPHYTIRHANLWAIPEMVLLSLLISWMAATRAKLREANELLDERVRLRTAELQRANFALQEREALLVRQSEELSQSNADLEQFAYVASHDLQEPLRMIAVYTELLRRNSAGKLDADAARFMQTVIDGVRRMEQLVHDLLTYSRAIHGEAAGAGEIDAGDALRAALLNLEAQIHSSGALIEAGELPKLVCDLPQLTQIFQNLIGNAIKYRGDQLPRITILAQVNGSECVFSVTDNGIGIHSDYHEIIFRPFKRLHGQQLPGSGVGLAICRRIVDRLGGRIWVESELGQGARFCFAIPPAPARKSLSSKASAT